jgi:hypothetical protein
MTDGQIEQHSVYVAHNVWVEAEANARTDGIDGMSALIRKLLIEYNQSKRTK